MPVRRKAPRVRLTISCLGSEWERIREIAERRGVSINDHAVSAGLSVELGPPRDAPALALSEAEQRRLLERVDRLADGMLADAEEGEGSIARLRQSVGMVLVAMLDDLLRRGRADALGPITAAVFGNEDGPKVERQLRAWMERNPPSG